MDLQTVEDNFAETMIIKIDFDTFDKKSLKTLHTGLIVLCIVLLIMLETLGNFLLFCLVWYEKYGMDAQKRTVTNQLLSSMCIAQILFNILLMPFVTFFIIMGPPDSKYLNLDQLRFLIDGCTVAFI